MPLKAFKRMKYTVKMRGKWCETHLRAKQMQNSAREKYKNMEMTNPCDVTGKLGSDQMGGG